MKHHPDIKMIFLDLDGSLLYDMDTITPRTRQAFERIREKGIIPVIATGRPAYESDFAIKAIGADQYFIAMNGLAVYKNYRAGTLFYEARLPESTAGTLLRLLLEQKVFFQAYAGGQAVCQTDHVLRIHTCGMTHEQIRFFSDTMLVVRDLSAYLAEKKLGINKFFVSIAKEEDVSAFRSMVEQVPGVRTLTSSSHFIEIIPEGADKQCAVRAVREACGLSREQVMVIGDSENDLGMFDEAMTRVAMENACDKLKAKANYIAPSNKNDGVAWALETLVLGGPELPCFNGRIEILRAEEINRSLEHNTRQYLAGDLKLPQELHFLRDTAVEIGLNRYPDYKRELPHYHTDTSEYCYVIAGETKYVDLSNGTEYHFRSGDFYILRKNTPYIQKCLPGLRMLFMKVPGVNDKVAIPMDEKMAAWCADWKAVWQ